MIMQKKLSVILSISLVPAIVTAVCVKDFNVVNCWNIPPVLPYVESGACQTTDVPGCEGEALEGMITESGVNQTCVEAGAGESGNQSVTSTVPCVATCTVELDCNGASNAGTISLDVSYCSTDDTSCSQ